MQKPEGLSSAEWKKIIDNLDSMEASDRLGSKEGPSLKEEKTIAFDMKPEELEEYLNRYVVDQPEAVAVLATKICTHFNRMKFEKTSKLVKPVLGSIKNNILMIGPTGVGKTFIVKLIADKIGVPFIKADATKFTETGYVGGDVEDLVRDLVHASDGDIKTAEYGIIYIDEIDKIASSKSSSGPDVSRTGVQRNLLKLMEEAEVNLRTPHDLASQMEAAMQAQRTGKVERKVINTKNILFIVSGAFFGLDKIISSRLNKKGIGFTGDNSVSDSDKYENIIKNVKTEDFISYGFESEFIGRLPVVAILNQLDKDGLYKILKNENSSVVLSKKLDFASYSIDLNFTDDALLEIACLAEKEKTGARGLASVTEKLLINFEKKLPSTSVDELTVDLSLIKTPDSVLQKLVDESVFYSFSDLFYRKHQLKLRFTEEAENIIRKKASEDSIDIESYLKKIFENYEYGLKLLQASDFEVTEEVAENPEGYLNNLIKENYNKRNNA